ncbi:hypothetical protein F4859DRAFT_394876 [Xylaria cf. heliscus]|nr:hypothetical protein F4859DRAFT_394876 [Xylaria cf. heliscus]
MPNTSSRPKATSVADLGKSLRLSSAAETEALLKSDAVREAFRLYRNRCLVSHRTRAASLPDWQEVDTFLYELRLSTEFRQHVRGARAKNRGRARARDAVDMGGGGDADPSAAPVDEYLAGLCACGPYVLMPHVAMFVLRVCAFWDSRAGRGFDVGRRAVRGDEGGGEWLFDRYSRIMEILVFLVARDIGR